MASRRYRGELLARSPFPSAAVYMHGTPAQLLFSRDRRDFSHGCIRFEVPARFAEWVLPDNRKFSREKIEAAMNDSRPQVNLEEKLTVYDTAHVDSKGVVHFADHYYGHGAKLEKALAGGSPYPRKS